MWVTCVRISAPDCQHDFEPQLDALRMKFESGTCTLDPGLLTVWYQDACAWTGSAFVPRHTLASVRDVISRVQFRFSADRGVGSVACTAFGAEMWNGAATVAALNGKHVVGYLTGVVRDGVGNGSLACAVSVDTEYVKRSTFAEARERNLKWRPWLPYSPMACPPLAAPCSRAVFVQTPFRLTARGYDDIVPGNVARGVAVRAPVKPHVTFELRKGAAHRHVVAVGGNGLMRDDQIVRVNGVFADRPSTIPMDQLPGHWAVLRNNEIVVVNIGMPAGVVSDGKGYYNHNVLDIWREAKGRAHTVLCGRNRSADKSCVAWVASRTPLQDGDVKGWELARGTISQKAPTAAAFGNVEAAEAQLVHHVHASNPCVVVARPVGVAFPWNSVEEAEAAPDLSDQFDVQEKLDGHHTVVTWMREWRSVILRTRKGKSIQLNQVLSSDLRRQLTSVCTSNALVEAVLVGELVFYHGTGARPAHLSATSSHGPANVRYATRAKLVLFDAPCVVREWGPDIQSTSPFTKRYACLATLVANVNVDFSQMDAGIARADLVKVTNAELYTTDLLSKRAPEVEGIVLRVPSSQYVQPCVIGRLPPTRATDDETASYLAEDVEKQAGDMSQGSAYTGFFKMKPYGALQAPPLRCQLYKDTWKAGPRPLEEGPMVVPGAGETSTKRKDTGPLPRHSRPKAARHDPTESGEEGPSSPFLLGGGSESPGSATLAGPTRSDYEDDSINESGEEEDGPSSTFLLDSESPDSATLAGPTRSDYEDDSINESGEEGSSSPYYGMRFASFTDLCPQR